MGPSQKHRIGLRPFEAASIFTLSVSTFLVSAFSIPVRATQKNDAPQTAAVIKATAPVDIVATTMAMSRGPWEGYGWSFYLLILEVQKVVSGQELSQYVRADFQNISVYTNSEEAEQYRHLVRALRDPQRTWRIRLRPPVQNGYGPECWKVPPPPTPGDLLSAGNPVMLAVEGVSAYPQINSLPCYVFDQRSIPEPSEPTKGK